MKHIYFSFYIALLSFIISPINKLIANNNEIIIYDVKSKTIDSLPAITYDTSVTFNFTSSNVGYLGNTVDLELTPPDSNVFEGSNFTKYKPTQNFYNVTDYPVSTSVKLFYLKNDSLKDLCSGTMVGDRFVLTDAHCVSDYNFHKNFRDSVFAVPVYDNGEIQKEIPASYASKFYVLKSWYDGKYDDIALIELEQPIGKITGWLGIAYSTDDQYFEDKVFHKFSYPATYNYYDSSEYYNGDTMYYNYGLIDVLSSGWLGIENSDAYGIPGQSGSPFFYTDNMNEYLIFGVLVFTSFMHYRIQKPEFYAFKNIIDSSDSNAEKIDNFIIYPNPTSSVLFVRNNDLDNVKSSFTLFDVNGRFLGYQEFGNGYEGTIDLSEFSSGLYFIKLSYSENVIVKKIVKN